MQKLPKIIATLGPATDNDPILGQMLVAGVDVVRINFSHGEPDQQIRRIEQVRRLSAELGKDVGVMADLQGPKVRIESFATHAIDLEAGQRFVLDTQLDPAAGDKNVVGVAYAGLTDDVTLGDRLLLNDGVIVLKVMEIEAAKVLCEVEIGGRLSDKKGLNIQGGGLSITGLTEKDQRDINIAVQAQVDYVAVSFVRDAGDIETTRTRIHNAGGHARVVAKIERTEALENLESIIAAADAVMVARGDLGVEIGYARLIGVQKRIIRLANEQGCVSITATQMMESMISTPMPTRAEVADVSNAVLDGTDAVMLSAESAVGEYPVETVQAMVDVCVGTDEFATPDIVRPQPRHFEHVDKAVAAAVSYTASALGARAVVCFTESGSTALWLSRQRSQIPIYALTRHIATRRRVSLFRGVEAVDFDMLQWRSPTHYYEAFRCLLGMDAVALGDLVIFTKGDQTGVQGGTNAMKILRVVDPDTATSDAGSGYNGD